MTPFPTLDALRAPLDALPLADATALRAAAARQAVPTKPQGSLGRLQESALFMAGWQGTARPALDRSQIVIFAANHGVCARGVNPYLQSVTAQMVANFRAGGASVRPVRDPCAGATGYGRAGA